MIDKVQTTRLPNGLIILTEHMPELRSISFGIWLRRGSRHETSAQNGICHFIEHALFKGTQRRSAHEIAMESDRLGGQFDAYTSHEMTGFAAKVVDTEMARGFELLAVAFDGELGRVELLLNLQIGAQHLIVGGRGLFGRLWRRRCGRRSAVLRCCGPSGKCHEDNCG